MKITTLIDHCGQLLNIITKNTSPSDKIVSNYFRSKKYIGSSERKFIAESVFSTIRNLILLKEIYNNLNLDNNNINNNTNINSTNTTNNNINNIGENLSKCFKNNVNSVLVLIQVVLSNKYINLFFNSPLSAILKKVYDIESNCETVFENIILEELNFLGVDKYEFNITLFDNIYNIFNEIDKNSYDLINNKYDTYKRFSFPEEFIDILLNSDGDTSTIRNNLRELMSEFNKPAPVCLRTNSRTTTREELANNLLQKNNIKSIYGDISPECLIIHGRYQLTELSSYKNGEFEIQDEASQLVAFCINPNRHDNILDACAGAGGKSLHLADLQKDSGRIVAADVEFMRLKEIPKRALRANLTSIETALVDNNFNLLQNNKKKSKTFPKEFDSVLVDAPCTGSGTVRREPMKKYRITKKIIKKMSEKQYEILTNFSKYVKKNGILVYSTCSIFSQENEFIIKRFLENNQNFEPVPIKPSFDNYNINFDELSETDFYLTLYPFRHHTDGFFISKIKRTY